MIDVALQGWHDYLAAPSSERLDAVLADDVVFYSPVVFTPQRGRDVTKLYLLAAARTLPGDEPGGPGGFRYTKQVTGGDTAVFEFETTVGGKYVNGVDIIRCDDSGRIVEFRVMIRPLQAVTIVQDRMRAALESMTG